MSEVLYDVDGHVATLTLNRPDARNSVNPELTTALAAAMDRLEADPDVWVGILTGTGATFCAGADLKSLGAGRAAELSTDKGGFAGFVRYPRTKPLSSSARSTLSPLSSDRARTKPTRKTNFRGTRSGCSPTKA